MYLDYSCGNDNAQEPNQILTNTPLLSAVYVLKKTVRAVCSLRRGGGLDVDDLPAVSSAASCEGLPLNCPRTLRGSGGLVLVGVSLERLSGACESWSMKLFCVCILGLCLPSMMDDIDFCHLEELAREVPA